MTEWVRDDHQEVQEQPVEVEKPLALNKHMDIGALLVEDC